MALRSSLTPLLLDTHAWVWWLTSPERLSRKQRSAIARARRGARTPLLVSIISCWEVALLVQRGRLRFSIPVDAWLEQATALPGLEVVPLTLATISSAVRLEGLRDPADQIVVATALERGARLVTRDPRIVDADAVAVIA